MKPQAIKTFSDGTISPLYFVVEGYMKYSKQKETACTETQNSKKVK